MLGMTSEACSEPTRTSKMALFRKSLISDVQLGSECVSGSPPQYVLGLFLIFAEFQPQFSYKTILIKKECIHFCSERF